MITTLIKLQTIKTFIVKTYYSQYATFHISLTFLLSLLICNSNKIFLLFTLLYIVILYKKTKNYHVSLLLTFITIVPFTKGRNLIETILINKNQISGYTIFDVKYFFTIVLSDLFLFLIYQKYLSNKINKNKKAQYVKHSTYLPLVMLSSLIIINSLRSINHLYNPLILISCLTLLKLILIFWLPFTIRISNKSINFIIQIVLSSTIFQSIIIIYEQIKGSNIGKYIENTIPGLELGIGSSETSDLLRANGTFNEPNIAATFLLINLSIIIFTYFHKKSIQKIINKTQAIPIITSMISIIAIIFTGSRSIYGLTALLLIIFLYKNKHLINQIITIIKANSTIKYSFIIIIILSLFIITPYTINRLSNLGNVLQPDGSISYRKELNLHAIHLAKDKLLGIGYDLTPYYLAKIFKTSTSKPVVFDQAPPHNIFVQIFTEFGIIGFISFSMFLYLIFRKTNKNKHPNFAIATFIYLLAAQFHPIFSTHIEVLSFFILYLGLSWYQTEILYNDKK